MSRISLLSAPILLGIAIVSGLFVPRLLDYSLGVLFLTAAAWNLWGSSRSQPAESFLARRSVTRQVMVVGLFGLFGGGAIAWGWLTAARVSAGVVSLALLAATRVFSSRRKDPEAVGCAILLGLFAVTGWFGLFPPYLEESVWPGTQAGRSVRGVSGYLMVWMAGLALMWIALAGARWQNGEVESGPRWKVVVAAIGFAVWLTGALYWCGES